MDSHKKDIKGKKSPHRKYTSKEILRNRIIAVVLAGGVSANSYLRSQIVKRLEGSGVEVVIPPLWCTTDNAAMIAKVGSYLYEEKVFAPLSVSASPCWKLEDFRKF